MGNQTLVPSQIQNVESYFLDLKSYIQFRASLGSTTFMKTAKVNLIESNSSATFNDEFIIETRNLMPMMTTDHHHHHHHHQSTPHHQSNIIMPTSNTNSNAANNMTTINSNLSAHSTPSASSMSQQPQSAGSNPSNINIQRLNQQQMIRQRLQALRDSQQQVVVKIFPK